MNGRYCHTCAWWVSFGNGGECHGGPPAHQAGATSARWAMTKPYDWFRVWKPREDLCGGKDAREEVAS